MQPTDKLKHIGILKKKVIRGKGVMGRIKMKYIGKKRKRQSLGKIASGSLCRAG